MLKRYQVLLSDWLAEYAVFVSREYDLSFSEAIRILICIGAAQSVKEIFPKYKIRMSVGKAVSSLRKIKNEEQKEEVTHRLISEGYFEARKAIEFRMAQAKKRTK